MQINRQKTIAELVLDHAECASVFQKHRIDFCCRGGATIDAACAERGVEVAGLVAELEKAIAERKGEGGVDARAMTTPSLIAHIIGKHHDYLRRAMPFIGGLSAKVARVHGERNARLADVDRLVKALFAALEPHLVQEETVLFPALMSSTRDETVVQRELSTMHHDHLAVGDLLQQLRGATDDFTPPTWACNSYRVLFAELQALEGDVLRHVHLENHVLMPRFAAA